MERIEPWRSSKAYSSADYRILVAVAREIQNADSAEVEAALNRFMEKHSAHMSEDYTEMSKPFLVLRVVFDLSENSRIDPKLNVMSWLSVRDEINADGSINLAWPLSFRSGKPVLKSRFRGLVGPPYDPVTEFRVMRAACSFRKI